MIPSTGTFALYFPGLYWLIEENLPDILALIFAEADFHSEEKLRAQLKTQVLHDGLLMNMDGKPGLGFKKKALDTQELSLKGQTRSFRTPRKQRNRRPEPNYSKDEAAWLTIEGAYGSFKVYIHTQGEWDETDQQWKYQVRQTSGRLHDDGKLVSEDQLHRTEK